MDASGPWPPGPGTARQDSADPDPGGSGTNGSGTNGSGTAGSGAAGSGAAGSADDPARDGPSERWLPIRVVLAVVGTASLIAGLVGIVVPVLPTTPFLLLAAACYARASTRLYGWLLGQPSLGPIISGWRRSRSLPPGVRTRALVAVALAFGLSIALVDALPVRIGLAIGGGAVTLFLLRIQTAADA